MILPRVFTAYKTPTPFPISSLRFTKILLRTGSIPPIKNVGTNIIIVDSVIIRNIEIFSVFNVR
jgi:hypothetical protein